MKKIIALLLVVILCVALVGCGGNGGMKFESNEAMYDHIEGVWRYGLNQYYVFNDGKIYDVDGNFRIFDDVFLNAWIEGGADAFGALTFEKAIKIMPLDDFEYNGSVTNYPENGRIVFGENSEFTDILQITKDGMVFQYDDETIELTKISDEIDLNIEELKECYDEQKQDYTLPVSSFIPDCQEYAEKLFEVFPEISNWVLAHETESSVIYTDTGSTTNYSDAFVISSGSIVLYMYSNTLQVTYLPENKVVTLISQDGTRSNEILQAAAAFVEDYPNALDMNEFSNQFEEKYTTENGYRKYSTTVGDIKYSIQRANDTNHTTLWVSF